MGSSSTAPFFLQLGTRWRRVANFTPQPPPPWGKSLLVPTEWEAVCPPQSVWLFWRYHARARSQNLDQPVQSLVTILTEPLGHYIRTYIKITSPSSPYTLVCLCHTIKHITVCKTSSGCSAQQITLDSMQICHFVYVSSCGYCGCYACHGYNSHFIYHSVLRSLAPASQLCANYVVPIEATSRNVLAYS
jgi:hypothetical protein